MTDSPSKLEDWNIANLAGDMHFSADGFSVEFSNEQVIAFVDLLNSNSEGGVLDKDGHLIKVLLDGDNVVLIKPHSKIYPYGVILPVEAFSDFDEGLTEGLLPAFRRSGFKIKRGFRVTSGPRKGRIVSSPFAAFKPMPSISTRLKMSRAAHKSRFVRALKSKLTKKKSVYLTLKRLNRN